MVNVASKCGYTDYNYKRLVQLQEDYEHKGFTVLAFPCNQFGQQEPWEDKDIVSFATKNYGANFPIFSKLDITGESAGGIYRYLIGKMGSMPSWNFCKYLVNRQGDVVQFFSEKDSFESVQKSIEYLLRKDEL